MKTILLWIFLWVAPLLVVGQSLAELRTTFYNLPIDSPRSKIRTQILLDSRFVERHKPDSSFWPFNTDSYLGNILNHNVSSIFKIDSASIELTWGYGILVKSKGKGKDLTFIRLQYFVSDSLMSNALFNMFWERLKSISSDTSDEIVGRKEDNNFSQGKSIKISKKKYLPSLSILQQTYGSKVFVVRLVYERTGI